MSTRKVAAITKELRGREVSSAPIRRVARQIDQELEAR
jgi:hypothetical protein